MLNDALLLELVLPAVDAPELVRSCALVSRRWAELARDEGLWARLLARDAPYQVHPLLYRRRCAGGAQVHARRRAAGSDLNVRLVKENAAGAWAKRPLHKQTENGNYKCMGDNRKGKLRRSLVQ